MTDMLFTTIFLFVLLVCLWLIGDARPVTKLILSFASLASVALITWTPAAVIITQCVLIVLTGGATFGFEWLNQNIR